MITPEIIEAGARALAERRGHNPDWPVGVDKHGYAQEPYVREVPSWEWFCKADAETVLTAALALHTPAMPGEIGELIERLEHPMLVHGAGRASAQLEPDVTRADLKQAAGALRSLVLEVERLETECDETRDSVGAVRAEYLQRWMDVQGRITQLKAALATAKAKPLTMPEGLPEGPLDVCYIAPYHGVRNSKGTVLVYAFDKPFAEAIASLPDLYAALAAARNKTIEECILTPVTVSGFGTASDDYLNGFQAGALAKTDSIHALATGETKPSEDSK